MSMAVLERELDAWEAQGLQPTLWWRDDDAVSATPALDRLTDMAEQAGVEITLAVIPAYADASLQQHVRSHDCLRPCVHGLAHTNHALLGEKKCELSANRDLQEVVAELQKGQSLLADMFGDRLLPALVPPWNRMRRDLVAALPQAGFKAYSTFAHETVSPMQVNTHVDVMDWRAEGGKRGKAPDTVLVELAEALEISRENGAYPIGVLSHHLVHDEAAWQSLDVMLKVPHIRWTGFPMP